MVSPNSSILDALPLSSNIDMEDVWNCEDHSDSEWISHKDPNQGYIKLKFTTPTPPNKHEVRGSCS